MNNPSDNISILINIDLYISQNIQRDVNYDNQARSSQNQIGTLIFFQSSITQDYIVGIF